MSSADDMGKWLRVQLDRGVMPDGKSLFSPAASTALWTPHTLMPITPGPASLALADPNFLAYALGFEVRDYRGHKIVTHLGGVLGGISAVVLIPDRRVAFAVMINSEDAGTLFAMREHLLDTLLDLPSPDWIASYQGVMRQEEAEARQAVATSTKASHPGQGPSLPMAGYVGVYKDPWYGTITIGKTGTPCRSASIARPASTARSNTCNTTRSARASPRRAMKMRTSPSPSSPMGVSTG